MLKIEYFRCLTIFIFIVLSTAKTVTKYDGDSNPNTQWRQSYHNLIKSSVNETDTASTKDRLQRLGYSTGYGTLNTYPGSTGLSAYNPIKLDLGGVVLGTLVGIGAIIIIPKILHAFHGGYGSYGRSEDTNEVMVFDNIVNKIDSLLGENNIDSTSCMQRAICQYAKTSENNIQSGKLGNMDALIHMLTENPLAKYLLDGTAVKEALDYGKKIDSATCDKFYAACPLDGQTVTKIFDKAFQNSKGSSSK